MLLALYEIVAVMQSWKTCQNKNMEKTWTLDPVSEYKFTNSVIFLMSELLVSWDNISTYGLNHFNLDFCIFWKDPYAGKDWRQEKGVTEDEMVGWHHRLNVHECEQAPGVGDAKGRLTSCNPWSHKELDMTERLNWLSSNDSSCWGKFS